MLSARAYELGWMLECIDDIDSDFRVFHPSIPDPWEIPGPEFFALAFRLTHYRGALRDFATGLAAEEEKNKSGHAPKHASRSTTPAPGMGGNTKTRNVGATRAEMESSPLAGLTDWE